MSEDSRPPAAPPAGWYADPNMVNTRRYWDGARWTEHRQEATAAAAPAVDNNEPNRVAVGWGVAFAILLPIVGFFIGLALLGKRGSDGIKIVVISVVLGTIYFFVFYSVHQENVRDACNSENLDRATYNLPMLSC